MEKDGRLYENRKYCMFAVAFVLFGIVSFPKQAFKNYLECYMEFPLGDGRFILNNI